MEYFFNLPSTIVSMITIGTLAVAGVFVVLSIFDKVRKQRNDDANKVDDRLINLLRTQVEVLEKKVAELEAKDNERAKRLSRIEARNEILEQVFQGRDERTQEFQKQGFATMQLMPEILSITQNTNKNVEKLYKSIEKFLDRIAEQETHK